MESRHPELIRPTAALVVGVFILDWFWGLVAGSTGSLAYGLVDEPAHLATCAVALLALVSVGVRVPARFATAALVAAIAIDLDHLPGYVGFHLLMATSMPRPYSHAVLTVVLLAAVGLCMRGKRRALFFGLAFGVAAHLCRDLATGPGIPLFWPLSGSAVKIPYTVYGAVLLGVTIGAGFGASSRRRSSRRPLRPPLAVGPAPSAGRPGGS